MEPVMHGVQRRVSEWSFDAAEPHDDPFNAIEVDVVFTHVDGRSWRVPAYWSGEGEWRIRFTPPEPGEYEWRSIAAGTEDPGLHGRRGVLRARPYDGGSVLLRRGPLRVSESRRYFEHADGTPFFWLGDTWWLGLAKRLRWPEDWQALTADRVAKGFTVVQLAAGLTPCTSPLDPRAANEGGNAWEAEYARINPAYFDMMDLRIAWLIRCGIIPCIVGSWGYHLPTLGVRKMCQHWRYLVARYSGYPVIWAVAGEATMAHPMLDPALKPEREALQKRGWTQVAAYVRSIDPFHHPLTVHPTRTARDSVDNPSLLDFDMLQTGGHNAWEGVPNTIDTVTAAQARTPAMPVINGEVCYEGHMQQSWQDVQRFMFWACMLCGAAGHTYGAGGIFQANTREEPLGSAYFNGTAEDTPYDEAMQYPGSAQLGVGKRLLERYPWWRLEPHPEWVEHHWTTRNYRLPYAAGIPGQLRLIYCPTRRFYFKGPRVVGLESGVVYRATYFDVITGRGYDLGHVEPDGEQAWQAPDVPKAQDWVLTLERGKGGS